MIVLVVQRDGFLRRILLDITKHLTDCDAEQIRGYENYHEAFNQMPVVYDLAFINAPGPREQVQAHELIAELQKKNSHVQIYVTSGSLTIMVKRCVELGCLAFTGEQENDTMDQLANIMDNVVNHRKTNN